MLKAIIIAALIGIISFTLSANTASSPSNTQSAPLLTFSLREDSNMWCPPSARIPITIPTAGLPGPGERMEVIWRTKPQRNYGMSNPANFEVHWTGYIYTGFHLYLEPVGGVALTPETHIGGFSQWSRTFQPGEVYWGPGNGLDYVEGGARLVHPWNLWPHTNGPLFEQATITLWVEPILYGGIITGGHVSDLVHSVNQELNMLKFRIVPE